MRTSLKLALAAAAAVVASPAAAQNLNVHATVVKNCVVTTTDLEFNDYDPLVVNSVDPQPGAGAIHVACTKSSTGGSFVVTLDNGDHFDTTRNMSNGTHTLAYDVLDVNNDPWPVAGVTGTPGGITPVDVVVNGSIPAAQDVSDGEYTDTLTVTVAY